MQNSKDKKTQCKSWSEAAAAEAILPAGPGTTGLSFTEQSAPSKEDQGCDAKPHPHTSGRDELSQGGRDPLHQHHDRSGSSRAAAAAGTLQVPQQETQQGGAPCLLVMGQCLFLCPWLGEGRHYLNVSKKFKVRAASQHHSDTQ